MIKRVSLIAAAIFMFGAQDALAACKGTPITGNSHAMRGGYFAQPQAVSYARQHWRYICTKRFGVRWCQPSRAASRRTLCRRVSASGPDRKFVCEFRARPCR